MFIFRISVYASQRLDASMKINLSFMHLFVNCFIINPVKLEAFPAHLRAIDFQGTWNYLYVINTTQCLPYEKVVWLLTRDEEEEMGTEILSFVLRTSNLSN